MSITIVQADFSAIGQLAKHCNKDKLTVAIEEAIEFDLKPLLCGFFADVKENFDSEEEPWTLLIGGESYEDCNGKTREHKGLKRALLYFIYARYVILNGFDDTATGMVQKTNDFSLPKPLKELEQFANKYRNMAYSVWDDVKTWICSYLSDDAYDDEFSDFDNSDCVDCGCVDEDCGDSKAKGFGIKGKNVSKWDV